MIKQKEVFFGALWRDYKEHAEKGKKEEAFVYKYMKRSKMKAAEKASESAEEIRRLKEAKKKDQFILVRSAEFALSKGVISFGACKDILLSTMGAREKKLYKNLEEPEILKEAVEHISERVLGDMVRDFFRDLGYLSGDSAEKDPFTVKSRKNYEILEMMLEFYGCEEGEIKRNYYDNIYSSDILRNEEYIVKCQKLYERLDVEKKRSIFLPLFIDSETGAGVYIIGADFYENRVGGRNCLIVSLSFLNILTVSEDEFLLDEAEEDDIASVCAANIDMKELGRYQTVEKAFLAFQNYLENTNYVLHREYACNNWSQKPAGELEEQFLPFFMEGDDIRRRIVERRAAQERVAFDIYRRERGLL